jgi:hypothetical protein
MNHDAVRRRLTAHLENRLSARASAQLEAHLDACPACREERDALDRTVHLLRGLEGEDPPADLAAKVFARLDAGEGRPSLWARWAGWWNGAWTAPLATGLAALALLVLVQAVEIRIGWPGAEAAPETLAIAAESSARPNPVAFGHSRSQAPDATVAVAGLEAGASLRTQCLRQPGGAACAAWHSWLLGLAVDEPRAFVMEVDAVPDSARSRWLVDLSRFAAHSGSAPRVAERLRQTQDPRAQRLAPHFEQVSSR